MPERAAQPPPGPWLTIVGLGEDGPDGLPPASRAALAAAEIVMGPPRHLALLPAALTRVAPDPAERIAWPVPFAEGVPILLQHRGRPTVALVSGDPFWFGAGTTLARALAPGEWRALPGPSCFAIAAARLGWPLERTQCHGLHAAPFERLRPDLAPGARLLATLRDGAAVAALATWLCRAGFGSTRIHILEALGGPRERQRQTHAQDPQPPDIAHPVTVALDIGGGGPALARVPGRPDDTFAHDGQITKAPVRALTLAALAPCAGERLWDIGAGSGAIALEWLLAHPATEAIAIEPRPDRAANIRANAARLGQERLHVVEGAAPAALAGLPPPDAVFIGGGLDAALLSQLEARLATGTRLVANAVTVETEALLLAAAARLGGEILRIELSHLAPLGPKRGWRAAYPLVQWSVTL